MTRPVIPIHTDDDTVRLAAAAWGHPLTDPVDLGGSHRSRVLRCHVEGGGTVVVKQFHVAGSEFARESVGLTLLGPTPQLLAADAEHRIIVMSDLGDGLPTLADLLLGSDGEAAWTGALSWARHLGSAVGASRPVAEEARRRIGAGRPGGPTHWDAAGDLRQGLARLAALAPEVTDVDAIESELAGVTALLEPGAAAVVWPTDTCPDNAVLADRSADQPAAWVFLDLEGTDVNHPALAAAYTMLPFATCWCVYDPPAGLTDGLLAAFSEGLGAHAPDVVAAPMWAGQVRLACAAYVVLVTGWLLDGAIEARPFVGPADRSPSYRQLVASRWRWGATNLRADFPMLSRALAGAHRWSWQAWGTDGETTGYPAFA
ncbi:hypothetical protein [Myceligenerans xiligouense]|uniref:Aminoglycoside phosphotransferase domain-containing protein n=1 Tax=Myceligenerans xiligouense TaxID=253184 RepID=A0A3N4ZLP3_9MICO|nr:hypothetical protein [Myceligenerans xiligouense]RPF21835.1 hypothetical protein EDD34_2471 [Myceligenerans xiligouense]